MNGPVIDFRLYRIAFVPALLVLVVLMFSVQPTPSALRPLGGGVTIEFDARRAAADARELSLAAPDRTPGGEGDMVAADSVAESFTALASGKVSEQSYEGDFDGDKVDLRNVILTLPGTSERTIVVLAHRDSSGEGDGTSTAAATGMLVELASAFSRTRHEKTLVFVSTDGGSEGASGAREFHDAYPTPELIDAVVVIEQPGVAEPVKPHVLSLSTDSSSGSAQLLESAKAAVEEEAGTAAGTPGLGATLAGLALPSGLGEGAALTGDGVEAITISSAGERPVHGSDPPTPRTMSQFGRAAFALTAALDQAQAAPIHGPSDYLLAGSNLIPGWPLALLALALMLPAAVAAVDGLARASRRGEAVIAAMIWGLDRALALLVPLGFALLLVLIGIAPDPAFPFDPSNYEFGWRAGGVLAALLFAFVLGVLALRPLSAPRKVSREALAPGLGVVAVASLFGIWLLNPYLALLMSAFGHLWILTARPGGPTPTAGVVVAAFVGAVPLAAAVLWLIDRLELGLGAPWQLLLMLTGGQIPLLIALVSCVLGGTVFGALAIARGKKGPSPQPELGGVPLIRPPKTSAGPSSPLTPDHSAAD